MMTPRSRARSTANQYGSPNSPVHQRGGVASSAMRGGPHPPTINIVDSSGHPNQQILHPNSYHENVNNYYDGGYHSNEQGRPFAGGSQPRYGGGGQTNEGRGRIANASLPTSPCRKRNTRPLEASRGDGISTSTSNLPAGGGAGSFYWAAKVYIYKWYLDINTSFGKSVSLDCKNFLFFLQLMAS